MQQRSPSSTRAPDQDYYALNISQEQQRDKQHSPGRMERCSGLLPLYSVHVGRRGRQIGRSWIFPSSEKWVHAIPVIVFLCLFILWWFSHSVHVVIKGGEIVVHELEKSQHHSNTDRLEVTILQASALSPFPSNPTESPSIQ